MEAQGPFVLQGYDSFEHEFYNIWPVEEYTYTTLEEALEGAEKQWRKIKEDQPNDGELQDELFILSLNGIRRQYP